MAFSFVTITFATFKTPHLGVSTKDILPLHTILYYQLMMHHSHLHSEVWWCSSIAKWIGSVWADETQSCNLVFFLIEVALVSLPESGLLGRVTSAANMGHRVLQSGHQVQKRTDSEPRNLGHGGIYLELAFHSCNVIQVSRVPPSFERLLTFLFLWKPIVGVD